MSRRKTKPPHRARLENEVAFLRKELERKDAILLNMTEGLGSLEAPREPRESPETASAGEGCPSQGGVAFFLVAQAFFSLKAGFTCEK